MAQTPQSTDLVVIGGGINGAAIARDAVGRGLKVMLAERDDYAIATSSASSKLIHGGLRYLEHYAFSLVRESLHERDVLLKAAPHLITPLRFLVPITADQSRPAWMVRVGLFLYDALAWGGSVARSGRLSKREIQALPRLRQERLKAVLHYGDLQVDDARLVLETLLDARARGAIVENRCEVTGITPLENGYRVALRRDGHASEIDARFVVNAAGPWANTLVDKTAAPLPRRTLRLVRGSHIVLPMPNPPSATAFTLQNTDGRVVFTFPWLDGRYLAIGTTDAPQEGDPAAAICSDAEIIYLLDCYNTYFAHPGAPASPDDIVWTWSGVRPLVDDGASDPSKVTREAQLASASNGTGGFITLYGGKLTTHRALAEDVLAKLQSLGAGVTGNWTAHAPLHGGTMPREALLNWARDGTGSQFADLRQRWALTYGSEAPGLLARASAAPDASHEIVAGITRAELRYAAEVEDARSAEDFLHRRTKLFISLDDAARERIAAWFSSPT
jgi:glycerol-3-phosphate dehydrogenase